MDYPNHLNIKSWAEEDRPREKLSAKGLTALSDAELIAILIRSGSKEESAVELSKKILRAVGNNLNELGKMDIASIMSFKGIGSAKAISIVAAMELGRRRREGEIVRRRTITCSKDAYMEIADVLSDLPHEEFWVLMLNRANKIISKKNVSKGGVSGTIADAKLIFKAGIEKLASSIILCHNHPSGNLRPSEADIKLTNKLKEAGRNLDLPVLDHLIIGDNNYYSFADEGLL